MFTIAALVLAAQATVPATPAAADEKKVVCRLEKEVYSRIPARVCRSQGEWDQIGRDTAEDLRRDERNRRATDLGN